MFREVRAVLLVECVTGISTGVRNIEQTGQFDVQIVNALPDLPRPPFFLDIVIIGDHAKVLATPEQLHDRGTPLFAHRGGRRGLDAVREALHLRAQAPSKRDT